MQVSADQIPLELQEVGPSSSGSSGSSDDTARGCAETAQSDSADELQPESAVLSVS